MGNVITANFRAKRGEYPADTCYVSIMAGLLPHSFSVYVIDNSDRRRDAEVGFYTTYLEAVRAAGEAGRAYGLSVCDATYDHQREPCGDAEPDGGAAA